MANEFENEPSDKQRFMELLDARLRERNSDYDAKRYKDITLDMPRLVVARPNLFIDWMKQRKKLGGQNKVPRLATTVNILISFLN